eukprot:6210719-Pleurochrysis_carterae.AAC.8
MKYFESSRARPAQCNLSVTVLIQWQYVLSSLLRRLIWHQNSLYKKGSRVSLRAHRDKPGATYDYRFQQGATAKQAQPITARLAMAVVPLPSHLLNPATPGSTVTHFDMNSTQAHRSALQYTGPAAKLVLILKFQIKFIYIDLSGACITLRGSDSNKSTISITIRPHSCSHLP